MIKHLLTYCLMVFALSSYGQCDIVISGSTNICSNSYSELIANYSGGGTLNWEVAAAGYGSFAPSNVGSSIAYFPSPSDSSAVTLRVFVIDSGGTCDGVEEFKEIYITKTFLNLVSNKTVCESVDSVELSASHNGTILWELLGATGTLSSATTSNTTYYPSAADKSSGFVIIQASSVNGSCSSYDSVLVSFAASTPTVSAGADATLCSNNPSATFYGSTTGTQNRVWSTSGTGIFATPHLDSSYYMPSAADIASGSVTLTLTATGCGTVSDNMNVNYTPSPQINVGSDQYLATENYLSASFSLASGVMWNTTGTGTFSPSATAANVVYTPGPAESWVIITATTTGASGNCMNVSDQLYLYKDSVNCHVNIGPDIERCSTDTLSLSAATDASEIQWSTTGNGTFSPNATSVNVVYTPAPADAGTTVYFIANVHKGLCYSSDTMLLTFTSATSIANAGVDVTACDNTSMATTIGYTNTVYKSWQTSGTGYFTNPYHDTTTYVPSFSDKQNGQVTLTLTAYGCGTVSDNTIINFIPGPVVEAGPNQQLSSAVSLSAAMTNAAGVVWSTSGTGTFSNTTSLTTIYTPSASDLDSGYVHINVATSGNGSCSAATDFLILTANSQVCNVTIGKTINANKVSFEAVNTDGQSVGAYFWDFGDSTYAYGKVNTHVYSQTGSYLVTLTFTTPDGSCTSSIEEVITITNILTSTYSISGTIYAGANKVDHAYVTLFTLDGNVYKYAQTVELSPADNGTYVFNNVPNGQYLIYAIPSSLSSYINYIACYFPNVTIWVGAGAIEVSGADVAGKNIYLLPFTPPNDGWNTGTAVIAGLITFDINTNLRITTPSANPSQYAVVSLYNEEGELLATTNTDEYGNYSFEGIASGNYTLKVEYPGGNASSASFPVTASNGSVAQVNTQITRQEITVGLKTETVINSVSLYPNPVQDELFVSLSAQENAHVQFYNSLGTMVYEQSITGTSKIEMTNLPSGIYSYLVIQGEQKFAGKVIKISGQ